MNNKTILSIVLFTVLFILPTGTNSQEDELVKECLSGVSAPYIPVNRSMRAFLTGDEVAEFRSTFFDGNTYRIVLCNYEPGLLEFSLYDTNRNLLFSSTDHESPSTWDFKMEGSMECIIEARLNTNLAQSGMAMLIIGFTTSELIDKGRKN